MKTRFTLALWTLLLWLSADITATAQPQPPRLTVQKGHGDRVYHVAFSADGHTLASSSLDHTIRLWDTEKGWELGVLDAENEMLSNLVFSGDGRRLVGFRDKLHVWDTANGRKLHAYSPEGTRVAEYLVNMDGRRLIVVRVDNAVEMLEAETGRVLKILLRGGSVKLDEPTVHLAASPDWKTFIAYSDDGLVRSLDAATGAVRFTFKATAKYLTVSRDGALVAFVDTAKRALTVLDAATGRELWQKPVTAARMWLAFDAEGRQLTAFDAAQTIAFDARGGGESGRWLGVPANPSDYTEFEKERTVVVAPGGAAYAFLPAGAQRAEIEIRARGDNRLLSTLAGRAGLINDVAFNPDGKSLVIAPMDTIGAVDGIFDKVFFLNYADGTQGRALNFNGGAGSLAYSPDGKRLATANSLSLALRDLEKGDAERRLDSSVSFGNVVFSPDGKLLACFNYKALKLWDAASGQLIRQLAESKEKISYIAFSRDGKLLAVARDPKDPIVLLDVATGEPALTLPNVAGNMAFSPDGKFLVATDRENRVAFVDLATGAIVRRAAAHPEGKKLPGYYKFTYSPDGKTLAAIGLALNPEGSARLRANDQFVRADPFIRLWDAADGRELRTLRGHTELITSLSFSGDGKFLLSGSHDRLARLWDVAGGAELASMTPVGRDDWIVTTPDGLFDGSPGAWQTILWRFSEDLRDVSPVEAFFNEYYYPNLLTELMSGKRPAAPGGIATRDRRLPHLDLALNREAAPIAAAATTTTANPTTTAAAGATAAGTLAERNAKIKVTVRDAPAGAKDVRLFRNGSLVRVWRGDVLAQGQTSVTLEATVPIIAGENEFTAYAFNRDNVKSTDARLSVTGPDALKRKGIIYMIVVGVNEYENAAFNLKYAVADAKSFTGAFVEQQARLGRYSGVKPVGLLDRNATKANILRTFAALAKHAQPEDAVIVYFAGHGMAVQNQFYLLPHDLGYAGGRTQVDAAALRSITAHGVSDRELETAFESVDAGLFLLVIDACNSGQALEGEERRRGPMNAKGLAQLAYEKGMYVLTAAQSFQAAQEVSKLGHGLLTYVLVEEGLQQRAADGAPKDGRILVREWLDYATRRVPEVQMQEIARSIGGGGDLSFADDVRGLSEPQRKRVSQRPRVFYRRDPELNPLVVARP